jgi:glutaredoxin 3
MAEIEIYSSFFCGYSHRAKRLLNRKGLAYREIDLTSEPARRPEMVARAGGRSSVPQIFIDGAHVGGNSELQALEASGELDRLLSGAP